MNNVDLGRYSKRLVQYIWDPEPTNDAGENSIWCLGVAYSTKPQNNTLPEPETSIDSLDPSPSPSTSSSAPPTDQSDDTDDYQPINHQDAQKPQNHETTDRYEGIKWPSAFLDDFESRIWLTYRSGFHPIPKSDDPKAPSAMSLSVRLKSQFGSSDGFTTDSGWGCMIRSGQCLLANAMAFSRLGRSWRRKEKEMEEREILRLFADDQRAPFSIHKFVEHGAAACGTYPGQWFGPSATGRCIAALANHNAEAGVKVYVTGDGPDIFEDSLFRTAKAGTSHFQPTLLLVGTRLGIDRITPAYWEALQASLQMPQSIGIAGGRPSSSHYFIGTQGSNFFYLDPHHTRPALPLRDHLEDYTNEEIDSCHTRRLRRIPLNDMDPSMLIAFLFNDEDDWRQWRQQIQSMPGKSIVHVSDSEPVAHGIGAHRDGAVDEVEAFDDDESKTETGSDSEQV